MQFPETTPDGGKKGGVYDMSGVDTSPKSPNGGLAEYLEVLRDMPAGGTPSSEAGKPSVQSPPAAEKKRG